MPRPPTSSAPRSKNVLHPAATLRLLSGIDACASLASLSIAGARAPAEICTRLVGRALGFSPLQISRVLEDPALHPPLRARAAGGGGAEQEEERGVHEPGDACAGALQGPLLWERPGIAKLNLSGCAPAMAGLHAMAALALAHDRAAAATRASEAVLGARAFVRLEESGLSRFVMVQPSAAGGALRGRTPWGAPSLLSRPASRGSQSGDAAMGSERGAQQSRSAAAHDGGGDWPAQASAEETEDLFLRADGTLRGSAGACDSARGALEAALAEESAAAAVPATPPGGTCAAPSLRAAAAAMAARLAALSAPPPPPPPPLHDLRGPRAPTLRALKLRSCALGEAELRCFLRGAGVGGSLEDLDVSGNPLGAAGAAALAKALRAPASRLTRLALGACGASEGGRALWGLRALVDAWAGDGGGGAGGGGNRALEVLDLRDTQLLARGGAGGGASGGGASGGGASGGGISGGFARPAEEHELVERLARGLAANCSMRELDLRGCGLGPRDLRVLTAAMEAHPFALPRAAHVVQGVSEWVEARLRVLGGAPPPPRPRHLSFLEGGSSAEARRARVGSPPAAGRESQSAGAGSRGLRGASAGPALLGRAGRRDLRVAAAAPSIVGALSAVAGGAVIAGAAAAGAVRRRGGARLLLEELLAAAARPGLSVAEAHIQRVLAETRLAVPASSSEDPGAARRRARRGQSPSRPAQTPLALAAAAAGAPPPWDGRRLAALGAAGAAISHCDIYASFPGLYVRTDARAAEARLALPARAVPVRPQARGRVAAPLLSAAATAQLKFRLLRIVMACLGEPRVIRM